MCNNDLMFDHLPRSLITSTVCKLMVNLLLDSDVSVGGKNKVNCNYIDDVLHNGNC